MAVITPVGKGDFTWSPKEEQKQVVKTASVNKSAPKKEIAAKTDKDLLYEAARKIVAQFGGAEDGMDGCSACDEAGTSDIGVTPGMEVSEVEIDVGDVSDTTDTGDTGEVLDTDEVELDVNVPDVQDAVAELVEKAQAADDMVEKIEEAVEKVEEAAQGVRSAVGADVEVDVGGDEIAEVEIDIDEEPSEVVEDDASDVSEVDDIVEVDESEEVEEEGGEDIIQESEKDEVLASAKSTRKVASKDDFVRTSKISPTTRKKVLELWKNKLGYAPDFCNLMVKNYEK